MQRSRVKIGGMTATTLATALAVALLAGCGGSGSSSDGAPNNPVGGAPVSGTAPTAVLQDETAGTPVDPAIVAADNGFGLTLLNTLIPGGSGNIAISPLSVSLALQIVYNGAEGTTQTAMGQTLEWSGLSASGLNSDNAALQASLLSADPAVQIILANSLWMHLSKNPVSASFIGTNQTYYAATIGDLSGAPDNVNAWVADETHGLITQILPAESPAYYDQTVAVIANTIYFKGQWSKAFDPSQTSAAPFTLSTGEQASAPMMHATASYPYFQGILNGVAFQAVQLPYGAGRLNMLIVLPDGSVPLSTFVAGVTADVLTAWSPQFKPAYVSISIPRFTASYGQSLPPALTTMGMGVAFCTNPAANFSAISNGACIDDVEHQTVVMVDESGTVATGATTVTIGTAAIAAPQFTMTMDHPFFYAVLDTKTGELLFVGLLMDPS